VVDGFDATWPQRLAARCGHFGPELLSVSVLAVIAYGLHPPVGPFALTAPLALLIFVLGSWVLMRRHDRGLCERCLAGLPLNAAEVAARYQRRFWLAHNLSRPRVLVPYLIVLVGSDFVATGAGRIVWAIVQSSMIYLIMSYTTHRRLQPWCPWCQGGDGGGEHAPTDPQPDDRRQLV
jgi:hypothetical protein